MLQFPNIDPVAFSIGPVLIRWYALAYLSAFMLGWRYVLYIVDKSLTENPDKNDIDDFLPWAILGVIFGGRLGYVLIYNPALYFSDSVQILQVWHGGMSFHGGLIGATVAMIIYCRKHEIPLLRLSDMVACAAPIGLFFGRIANFINGELYGRETDVPWGMRFPGAGEISRHPSQLYEATLEGLVLFLVLFLFMRIGKVRETPGVLSGLFLAGYGLSRIIVEQFREPDYNLGLFFGHISMGQLLSFPMLVGGLLLAFILYFIKRKTEAEKS